MNLSIIIITHSNAKIIGRCLEAVACQLQPNDEIIVLDNGSTDHTLSIIKEKENDQIYGISSDKNLGISRGRNSATQYSHNPFLFFLDSDIILANDAVEKIREDLMRYDAVIGGYTNHGKGLVWYREIKTRALSRKKVGDYRRIVNRKKFTTLSGGFFGIRKEIFLKHKGFDDNFEGGALEDIDLELRLLESGHTIYYDGLINGIHQKDEMRWSSFLVWCWKCSRGNSIIFKKWIQNLYKLPITIYYPRIPLFSLAFLIMIILSIVFLNGYYFGAAFLIYIIKALPYFLIKDSFVHKIGGSLLFMMDELLTLIFFLCNLIAIKIRKEDNNGISDQTYQ